MQTKIKLVLQVLVIVLQILRNPRLLFVNAASYNYEDQDVVLLLPEEREEASMMTVVKPFDVGLWCTIAGSFIYAVSVTWLLEQRISNESSTEIFTHIWSRAINMSLSSFNIQTRLARFVIAVWLLVVSVLAIGYTTNYIVMLNVQKVNVNEIIASGAIGYLKHHLSPGYEDWSENLKAYTTEEECAKALSQGPNRGGVGVILMDRLDALLFISRRPGYTYIDIPPEADTPRSLGVLDFMVWFIITGTASTLGLIKFIFDLLYSWMHRRIVTLYSWMHRRIVTQSDSPESRGPTVFGTGTFRPSDLQVCRGHTNFGAGKFRLSDSPESRGSTGFGTGTFASEMVRRRAPATADTAETRRENPTATPSPAEGNASWGDDDEDYRSKKNRKLE